MLAVSRTPGLVRHRGVRAIVGDVVTVSAETGDAEPPRLGDLAVIREPGRDGRSSLAQIVKIDGNDVALQVFAGGQGVSTHAGVTFLGTPPDVVYSRNALGRVFDGAGFPIDRGPPLDLEPTIPVAGAPANPMRRAAPSRMIRTGAPMIDIFNSLVESQKIPIFSVAGERYNQLLTRIGIRTDADIVVFGGLSMIYDDYHACRTAFAEAGVSSRTIIFINLATDPLVERLLIVDLALAVAERFAVEQKLKVLVLLTDMTAFADALNEIGLALDRVPANRGYLGDLYSQLARRYERACTFAGGGSVTVLSVCTMPGGDVTHPSPDNTGYITEGQFYLHDGVIDPFGSLSRLKQRVIGKETRDDHGQLMTAMIRLYAEAQDAAQKRAMAFDLGERDLRLLAYADLFRERFMRVEAEIDLEAGLDLGWATLAACFSPAETLIKQELIDAYWPASGTETRSGRGAAP